jgi:hypothetical protein
LRRGAEQAHSHAERAAGGAISAPCPRHRPGVSVRRDDATAEITHSAASGTIPALFAFRQLPAQPGDHHSPAANRMTSPA